MSLGRFVGRSSRKGFVGLLGVMLLMPWVETALAQQAAPGSQPAPVQTAPLAPPPAAPPPAGSQAQQQDPPASPAPAPTPTIPAPAPPPDLSGLPTLAPGTTDTSDADEVMLTARPVASLRAQGTWDSSYAKIAEGLRRVREELAKNNIKEVGRPLVKFIETDDMGFRFEAMIPIDPSTDTKLPLGNDVRFDTTPAGKAIRFGHQSSYDDIDATYETLTAYLDAKGLEAQDYFIEEYLTENLPSTDPNFTLHIYVFPK